MCVCKWIYIYIYIYILGFAGIVNRKKCWFAGQSENCSIGRDRATMLEKSVVFVKKKHSLQVIMIFRR